jgi:hypothetical protein
VGSLATSASAPTLQAALQARFEMNWPFLPNPVYPKFLEKDGPHQQLLRWRFCPTRPCGEGAAVKLNSWTKEAAFGLSARVTRFGDLSESMDLALFRNTG